MSPPVEPTNASTRMSIHELNTTSVSEQESIMSLTEFLNSSVNDDSKNVIVRVGLNENQVIHIQYCQNGEITPYLENIQPGNRMNEPPIQESGNNISTENDDQTLEDDDDDDDDSNASRVEGTQEELDLRESLVCQEETAANQFEIELTNREHMLQLSLCAREDLIVRREYEATRRHRFLKLRERFIQEHEENDTNATPRGLG